ncbi:MAG: ABC transporter [Myxococcales bacterium]|nr:MAG: ABC transporter [Myxococcales bacterium]
MKYMWSIAKKEFASYFNSPIAYIVISVFLLINGWFFFQQFFLVGQATLRGLFSTMPILYMFFAPAITMRLIAEERKTGTLELLVTLPLRNWDIVVGKFLAGLALLLLATFLTLPYAITVGLVGELDWGPVIGGYLGLTLLGAGYVALGTFCSALTRNQIVAFIIGLALCFVVYMFDKVLFYAPAFMASFLEYLSIDYHFSNIARGVIDTRDLVYYASFVTMFLMFSVYALDSERLK